MNSTVLLNSSIKYWGTLVGKQWKVQYTGSEEIAHTIFRWLEAIEDEFSSANLIALLLLLPNEWALVAESNECCIAATDKIRSYPLFYSISESSCVVSNSARVIRTECNSEAIDKVALLEFRMAGYVTGRDTLFEHVKQLQAGDLLVARSGDSRPQIHRYYRYLPKPERQNATNWVEELVETTEGIFKRLIENAQGRQLLVPLSGGLDSRLIVCVLRHLGYDNVRTFSYGPPGNYEAKIARQVAETLGYPWEFVATTHSDFRDFFWSVERKQYWDFADGLCSIPGMQDIHSLLALRKRGLSEKAIVVNGQSGDFISGGHVPAALLDEDDREGLLKAILDKHLALRRTLRTPPNIETMKMRLANWLLETELLALRPLSSAALYESWECQERQSKYVINAQRCYDWLELDWRLPLWDSEYLRFWSRVPFELKFGQQLYTEYLRSRDYYRLFRDFDPTVWRWPGATVMVVPFARVVGALAGNKNKNRIYEYARYFGHYGPYYAPWGWRNFARCSSDIRNPITLFVEQWLRENGIVTSPA